MNQEDMASFINKATGLLVANQSNHFLLVWEGSKLPSGAYIDDYKITWTQHGMVQGVSDVPNDNSGIKVGGNMPHVMCDNKRIGYYSRLEEFGGETDCRQVMVISTNGNNIKFPEGFVQCLPVQPDKKPNISGFKIEKTNG